MLTRKQHELLTFIYERIRETGVSPSFDEMKDALDLKSKSGIHRLVTALEEREFIRRLPHRARALEVLRLPDSAAGTPPRGVRPTVVSSNPEPKKAPSTVKPAQTSTGGASVVSVPLVGKIAAGTPIEALQDNSNLVDVPASMLGGGEHYAVTIEGDSMVNAGIFDGDTALIKRGDTADNGDIVVALVDSENATLKRLRRKGDSIALEPANDTLKTQIYPADQVKVQGRLVGLVRRY